jgi:hypothetical protein
VERGEANRGHEVQPLRGRGNAGHGPNKEAAGSRTQRDRSGSAAYRIAFTKARGHFGLF